MLYPILYTVLAGLCLLCKRLAARKYKTEYETTTWLQPPCSLTTMSSLDSVFTLTSALSLAGVAAIALLSVVGANALLPKNARCQDRFTFIWLVSSEEHDPGDDQ